MKRKVQMKEYFKLLFFLKIILKLNKNSLNNKLTNVLETFQVIIV